MLVVTEQPTESLLSGKCDTKFVDIYEVSKGNHSHNLIHFDWCGDNDGPCAPALAHPIIDFFNFGQPFAIVLLFNLYLLLHRQKGHIYKFVESF